MIRETRADHITEIFMVSMTAPFGLVSFPLSRLDTLCNDPHAPTAALGDGLCPSALAPSMAAVALKGGVSAETARLSELTEQLSASKKGRQPSCHSPSAYEALCKPV